MKNSKYSFAARFRSFLIGSVWLAVSAGAAPPGPTPTPPTDSAGSNRNFYQVLDEVLADFEFDLKSGNVLGLKDLAVRGVALSENIPPSFRTHLENLVTEKIMKTTKTRIVNCPACRSKKTTLSGDQMIVATSDANPAEQQRVAKLSAIQNFMDVAFAYQPNGMVLSFQILDTETGTLLWSRSYNSENTRASAQRRGVDYEEKSDLAMQMEYAPTIQIRPVIYLVMAPKAPSGHATALGFGFRMMERYDNRKKEVGFELNYYYDVNSLTGNPESTRETGNIYRGVNLTLMFVHAWSLFGEIENYNQARGTIFAAVGGTYASGFLGGVIRGGYEWRLGKHWVVPVFLGYRPKGTVVLPSQTTAPLSGVEGGLGVGYLF